MRKYICEFVQIKVDIIKYSLRLARIKSDRGYYNPVIFYLVFLNMASFL